MLKARSAHEDTIRTMCQRAGQGFVKLTVTKDQEIPAALNDAAQSLVDTVLAEAGREFVTIEPNFLIKHAAPDIVVLGRVRSMLTELAGANTALSKGHKIELAVGNYPARSVHEDKITLNMPESVWVVDVPATKENVAEEAKWLIDVAISLMRLSVQNWRGLFPEFGEIEAHPTYPTIPSQSNVTMENDTAYAGGGTRSGWYEISTEIVAALKVPEVQSRAEALFDPKTNHWRSAWRKALAG